MKATIRFIILSLLLTGCSEMKIIGNAAMRELRADGVRVNWEKTVDVKPVEKKKTMEGIQYASARTKTFSAFRKAPVDKKKQVKGLWEQHGS